MISPAPVALLHRPAFALGGCLFGGIERDTRGCTLDDRQRLNHYPATPMAVLSWIFEGELRLLSATTPGQPPVLGPPLPRLVLSGPQRRPTVSWSPGPVHALSVAFYPEAMHRLLGQPLETFLDTSLPLETVAPPALLAACEAVWPAAEDQPFACLQQAIVPLWQGPAQDSSPSRIGDWTRRLATHLGHATAGRGLRQGQRRLRQWTGQNRRELAFFAQVEEAFIAALNSPSPRNFAALAADTGYADQSHLGRAIRRATSCSPAHFFTRLEEDEAFWYYRLAAGEIKTGRSTVNGGDPRA